MALSSKPIFAKAKEILESQTLNVTDLAKVAGAVGAMANGVLSVELQNDLPPADISKGKLIYIKENDSYTVSNGIQWTTPEQLPIETIPPFLPAPCGEAWAWGYALQGGLGVGCTVERNTPVKVLGGFTDWCKLSFGPQHSAGVKADGTLWTWGDNWAYQTGTGTNTTDVLSPTQIPGTDWVDVAAHPLFSTFAIKSDGTMWAAGIPDWPNVVYQTTFAQQPGDDWAKVFTATSSDVNGCNMFALKNTGTLWARGLNLCGSLGVGDVACRSTFTEVAGGFTDWCTAAVGIRHTAALRTNGTMWSWGNSLAGVVGDGTFENRSSPVEVLSGFTDWCDVSAGGTITYPVTMAIRENGTLWGIGSNNFDQFAFAGFYGSPMPAYTSCNNWAKIALGEGFALGIQHDGSLWSWGLSDFGQLGVGITGSTATKTSPMQITAAGFGWSFVTAGALSAAAIKNIN